MTWIAKAWKWVTTGRNWLWVLLGLVALVIGILVLVLGVKNKKIKELFVKTLKLQTEVKTKVIEKEKAVIQEKLDRNVGDQEELLKEMNSLSDKQAALEKTRQEKGLLTAGKTREELSKMTDEERTAEWAKLGY